MVVVIIDNVCITVHKLEKHSPVARDSNGILPFFITCQFVKKGTRVIHVFYFICGIQSVENPFKSSRLLWPNTFLFAGVEKVFEAFVFK